MKHFTFIFVLSTLLLCNNLCGRSWIFDNDFQGWRVANALRHNFSSEGLALETGKNTWLFSPPLKLDASTAPVLEVVVKSATDCKLTVYFRNSDNVLGEARKLQEPLKKSEKFQVVRFDCRKSAAWKGVITEFRLDPGTVSGNDVVIRAVRFQSASEGLVPNSSFTDSDVFIPEKPDRWTGDIVRSASGQGALVKAESSAQSDPVEIIDNQPLEFKVKGGDGCRFSVLFFDIFGHPLKVEEMSSIVEVPQDAALFRVNIANPRAEAATVQQVFAAFRPRQSPSWNGDWIWNKFIGEKSEYSALFIREFDIPELSAVESATLQGTADDWLEVAVNGHCFTGPNAWHWGAPDYFDIKPYLKPGKNELRAHVVNGGGAAGLLLEIQILEKGGRVVSIGTDLEFLTWHLKKGTDWKTFNWRAVTPDKTFIVTRPGNSPWGKIAFVPPVFIQGELTVEGLPEKASENSRGTIHPVLRLSGNEKMFTGKRPGFTLHLKNEHYNVLLFDTELDGNVIGKQIDFGEVPFNFHYLPAGKYQVVAEMDSVRIKVSPTELVMDRSKPVRMASARIIDRDTVPKLLINESETVFPDAHLATIDRTTGNLGQIKNAIENGSKSIWLHYPSWRYRDGGKSFDFDSLDDMCANILTRNPEAHIILCVYVDGVGVLDMRRFWNPANEDELARLENGSTWIRNYSDTPEQSPSMASSKYLAEGDRVLSALYEHLKSQPYGERVVGILPSSGLTWEWMYWGAQKGDYGDYSKPFQSAFRKWALERYGSLDAVNQAWHTAFPDENAIVIPTISVRNSRDFGDLRRPTHAQYLIDFQEFFSYVVSEAILHFTGTIKRVSGGKLLTGAYYGYTNFLMSSNLSHNTGHYALKRVLGSPDFDIQTAPSRYADRGEGGAGGFMMPEASTALHGKLCVTENDIRTVHANNPIGKVHTLLGSKAVLEREAAACLVSGGTVRWFDFSHGWINGDKRLAEVGGNIARVRRIVSEAGIKTLDPANSVAVLSSETATRYTGLHSSLNSQLIGLAYKEFFRSGAGFDCYLFEDIEKIPPYHSWIFLNALRLNESQRGTIENLKKDGNLLIFTYGVDLIGDKEVNAEAMSKLLGFPVTMKRGKNPLKAKATINGVAAEYQFGGAVDPVFVAQESDGLEVLGRFTDGTPALVRKKTPEYTVVFSSVPGIPAPILRELLRDGGVRIYNPHQGDVTWASDRLFCVYTVSGGDRVFPATGSKLVRELLTDTVYPVKDGQFRCLLPQRSTSIFLLEK